MNLYADLHCHSTSSDGSLTPQELIRLAHEKGLKGLSITDHDTLHAYESLESELPLQLLPGVEFSCEHEGKSVHILGYGFSLKASPLLEFTEMHAKRRKERNQAIVEKLKSKGFKIDLAEVEALGGHVIGRPHIAYLMQKKGYVSTIQEAFKQYIGDGKSCFAQGKTYSVLETIKRIHLSQGLAVIAHPHLLDSSELLQALLHMPFDGIETRYALYPELSCKRWMKIAKKKGWLETGGSDFHGLMKPQIPLGASGVTDFQFQQLWNHYQTHAVS